MHIQIRAITNVDCEMIAESFKLQGWNKPVSKFQTYLREQSDQTRDTWLAFVDGAFAGYLTILWKPSYLPFREKSIPEIQDLNVLKSFQRRGVASHLLDHAENLIYEKGTITGIAVGLITDYGNAQKLYVKRGYLPDGKGISQNGKIIIWGEVVTVNDQLVLYLTKQNDKSPAGRANSNKAGGRPSGLG